MSVVDDRIVKLGFDNTEFEKNVAKTRKSLKSLDEDLKLEDAASKCEASCDAINNALSNLNVDAINKFVDKSLSRFNVWGKTIQNIVDSIASTAFGELSELFTSVPSIIVSAGRNRAQNIENARFQLKGLGMDVEQIMDDANYAVSGTAYGLDQAAKAAAQFGASGIQAGEEMKMTLRSVSGVAAMTNTDFTEIARIFTAIAGTGRVQTVRIQQLSDRGLRVTGKLAEAYGVTEQAMSKMISKGQVDAKTFFKVMNDAFGEHATKANETYSGSLGNVRAALGRIGEKFETKKLESFRRIFVSMIPVINNLKTELTPFIDGWNVIVETVTSRISKLLDKIKAYQDSMKDSESIFTKMSKIVLALAEDYNKLLSAIAKGIKDGINPSVDAMTSIVTKITEMFDRIRPSLETLTTLSQIVARITYTIKNLIKLGGQLFTALYDAVTGGSGTGILEAINGIAGAIAYLSNKILLSEKSLNYLTSIFGGIASAGRIVLKIAASISNVVAGFIMGLTNIETDSAMEGFLGLLSVIARLVTKIETFLDEIGFFEAISKVVYTSANFIGAAVAKIVSTLSSLFGGATSGIRHWFESLVGEHGLMGWLTEKINIATTEIQYIVAKVSAEIVKILNEIRTTAVNAFNTIANALYGLWSFIKNQFTKAVKNVFNLIKNGVTSSGTAAEESASGWEKLFTAIRVGITGIGVAIGSTLGTVLISVLTIVNRVTKPIKGFGDLLSGRGDTLSGFGKSMTGGESFAESMDAFGAGLLKGAKALAIFAASLAMLTLVDSQKLNAVKDALLPLIVSVALFGSIAASMSAKSSMAKGIKSLVDTVRQLFKLPANKTKIQTISDTIKIIATSVLELAAAVGIMVLAFKISDWGFYSAVGALLIFLITLSAVSKSLVKVAKDFTNTNNLNKIIVALSNMLIRAAIAMRILMGTFKGFDNNQWGVVLAGMLSGMTALGGLLALSMFVIKQLNNANFTEAQVKTVNKLTGTLMKLALSIIPMAIAIEIISNAVESDGGIMAAFSIAAVLGSMVILIKAVQGFELGDTKKFDAVSRLVLSIGATMLLLGWALNMFSGISVGNGTAFFAAFASLLGGVMAITAVVKNVTPGMDGKKFQEYMNGITIMVIGLSGGISIIALSMRLLTEYDWPELMSLTAMVASFMGGVIGLVAVVSKMKNVSFGQLIGLTTMLTALGVAIGAMSYGMSYFVDAFKDLNGAQIVGVVASLTVVMIAMVAIVSILDKISGASAALGYVALIIGVIGAAVLAIGIGTKYILTPIQQILDFIDQILQFIDKLIWAISNSGEVVAGLQTFRDNFELIAESIANGLTLTFDYMIDGFIEKAKQRIPELKEIIPVLKATLNTCKDDIKDIITELAKILGAAVGQIFGALGSGVWEAIVTSFQNIFLNIAENTETFVDAIGTALEGIFYGIADFFDEHSASLMYALGTVFTSILKGALKGAITGITSTLESMLATVSSRIDIAPLRDATNWLHGVNDWLATPEEQTWKDSDFYKQYLAKIEELKSGSLLDKIKTIIEGDGESSIDKVISDAVNNGKNSIIDGLFGEGASDKPLGETLKSWLNEQGLSNLFGEGDALSLFGAESGSGSDVSSSILQTLNSIDANTLSTAGSAETIKNNTEDMTVTLDSGQVVGAIAPDMYDALGRIRTQKGRGN